MLMMLLISIENFFQSSLADGLYTLCHNFFAFKLHNKLHLIIIEQGNLSKQTGKMPNNKKKRMSFGSSTKVTNNVKKAKAEATLMETKTLP